MLSLNLKQLVIRTVLRPLPVRTISNRIVVLADSNSYCY